MRVYKDIQQAYVERENHKANLCLHYDPALVSLNQVRRWAEQEGAGVSSRYRHEFLRITDMDCGNCATSIEHILGRVKGIITVSVKYAAEKMRVEYDGTLVTMKILSSASACLDIKWKKKNPQAGCGKIGSLCWRCSPAFFSRVETRVFLMADAVGCALPNQNTPQGYYNIARMLKSILARGGKVKACGSCVKTRGLRELKLIEGVEVSNMSELAQWSVDSDKILIFACPQERIS